MRRLLSAILLCMPSLWANPQSTPKTVAITEATNVAATVSPDGQTIVVDIQGILWSIPFNGGTAKPLTVPLLEAARPDYSPKGGLIAFQAYQGGTFHIWTIAPDGSHLRQLTTSHGDDCEPRVSPDGTKIAFASDRAFKGSYDIWVADIASGALTQWTSGPADEFEPAWSRDGSEIAFVSGIGSNGTSIQASSASGPARKLAEASGNARLDSPSWSPDGNELSYVQFENGKSRLFVPGQATGEGDDVFPFPPVWLPGNRILYRGTERFAPWTWARAKRGMCNSVLKSL